MSLEKKSVHGVEDQACPKKDKNIIISAENEAIFWRFRFRQSDRFQFDNVVS